MAHIDNPYSDLAYVNGEQGDPRSVVKVPARTGFARRADDMRHADNPYSDLAHVNVYGCRENNGRLGARAHVMLAANKAPWRREHVEAWFVVGGAADGATKPPA